MTFLFFIRLNLMPYQSMTDYYDLLIVSCQNFYGFRVVQFFTCILSTGVVLWILNLVPGFTVPSDRLYYEFFRFAIGIYGSLIGLIFGRLFDLDVEKVLMQHDFNPAEGISTLRMIIGCCVLGVSALCMGIVTVVIMVNGVRVC